MKIIATIHKADWLAIIGRVAGVAILFAGILLAAGLCTASPHDNAVPNIFEPNSTPAESIRHAIDDMHAGVRRLSGIHN